MPSLEIRKYRNEDIDGFYEAVIESKNEVAEWLPWCHNQYSIEETHKWIKEIVPSIWQSRKGCEFIIIDPKHNKVMGGCCLEQIKWEEKEASIGYWVRTSETKKGIATKACLFLLAYGFEELNMERIKIIPSVENQGSVRVAGKLPFEEIQRVKGGFQIRNQVSDALVFIVTKESFYKDHN